MILETYLDRSIGEDLTQANEEERAGHISSGKLVASALGKPLQSQILKVIGVPPKPIDDYVLRKMVRGRDVEDRIITHTRGLVEAQKEVLYRDVVGLVDAMVDSKDYDFKCGIIPHEVKSVANAKFKRIQTSGEADRSHKLQACLYALALDKKYFAIDYIAADDYRVLTWIYPVEECAEEVEGIITKFDDCLLRGYLPKFEAMEKWQANEKYSDYPDWLGLDAYECETKLRDEFPEAYNKLKGSSILDKDIPTEKANRNAEVSGKRTKQTNPVCSSQNSEGLFDPKIKERS